VTGGPCPLDARGDDGLVVAEEEPGEERVTTPTPSSHGVSRLRGDGSGLSGGRGWRQPRILNQRLRGAYTG
jgi:hypothetical protein